MAPSLTVAALCAAGWGTPASRSGSSTPSGSGSKGSSRSGSGSLGVPAGARLPGAVPSLSGPGSANSTFAVPDLPSGGVGAPWFGAQSSSRTALVSSQEPVSSTFAAMGSTSGGFGVLSGKAQSGAASRLGGMFAAQDGPQLAAATGLGSASSVFAASSFASTAPSLTLSAPGLGSAFGPTTAASSAASHFAQASLALPGSSQQKQGQLQLQQQQQQHHPLRPAAAAAAEGSQQAPWAEFQQRQELQQQASGSQPGSSSTPSFPSQQQPAAPSGPLSPAEPRRPGAAERQKAAAKVRLSPGVNCVSGSGQAYMAYACLACRLHLCLQGLLLHSFAGIVEAGMVKAVMCKSSVLKCVITVLQSVLQCVQSCSAMPLLTSFHIIRPLKQAAQSFLKGQKFTHIVAAAATPVTPACAPAGQLVDC